MANKIADIDELEYILTHRRSQDGVQVGHYWSVLQIYLCIKKIGISIKTLCELASMITDRVDSKYKKSNKAINHLMIRKNIRLESTPCQIGHTVITKQVSKGIDQKTKDKIVDVLTQHNSYGPEICKQLFATIDSGKGNVISSKATTMGVSDFTAVLQMSLILIDMHKEGYLDGVMAQKNTKHKEFIIKKIKEYQNSNENITENIGFAI